MSDQQRKIYQSEGDRYEALISREDYQGNIPRAIDEIVSVDGLDVLDLGAGTGRLTLMLAPRVKSIRAFDASAEMLRVCRERLMVSGLSNWQVDVADHRQLPVEDHSVDLVVSGWSVSYLAVWNPDSWRRELEKWLGEMKRVLNGGSFIILFESLGTGNDSPIQLDHLKDYYPWLEEVGFQSKWIRTDYKFESIEEAEELSRFFFGNELGDKVRKNNWIILPECTGVWWKKISVNHDFNVTLSERSLRAKSLG
ncbi:MAG: class I SAM-dependent methyltransferase [Anaerolineae bacterium]|nr:class I SAM-dependent methyltransferase [Anaerolineae bacterium]MCI0609273.1 class I SAM-dependent methyltransferase [Anaerolineae bacterium]